MAGVANRAFICATDAQGTGLIFTYVKVTRIRGCRPKLNGNVFCLLGMATCEECPLKYTLLPAEGGGDGESFVEKLTREGDTAAAEPVPVFSNEEYSGSGQQKSHRSRHRHAISLAVFWLGGQRTTSTVCAIEETKKRNKTISWYFTRHLALKVSH